MPTPAVPPATIRAWARSEGLDVAERGRLKPEIVDAFNAAHRRAKATSKKSVPAAKPKKAAAARKSLSARSAAATVPAAESAPDAAEVAQDRRIADLEAAISALTTRIAKLEAVPAAPAPKKRFSRKA